MLFILLYIFSSAAVVFADVSILNPLDNQLPLIARVNEPFSWTFSPNTFSSTDGTLTYTISTLPEWLTFDAPTRTLRGTPSSKDVGNPEMTVTGHDSTSSAPSHFTLCVTPYPAPTVQLPIAQQFRADNPSLSSVFLVSPDSAIAMADPSLRIPPKWSFSVGFESNTFESANNIYYDALQKDGSALPDWVYFDKKTITFDGVAPESAQSLSLLLYASDQEGYSASSLPFNLIVAAHELSLSTQSLPTINMTASTLFNVSLSSPDDFSGVLVDGKPVQLSDITSLAIDTTQYGTWLSYDPSSRQLSGQPPDDLQKDGHVPILPVTLTSSFNQTIHTNVSLAVVPSYFTSSDLDAIICDPGQQMHFNLTKYFTNATRPGDQLDDVNLTAAYDVSSASNYLSFDPTTAQLSGTIPQDLSATGTDPTSHDPHISVTFTAYSHITHSTSHTTLKVSFTHVGQSQNNGRSRFSGLSVGARAKLAKGLGLAFGIIGGLVMFGLLLAAFRRCARVEDTAVTGEEAGRAWTDAERKWYGIGAEVRDNGKGIEGHGYGWTEKIESPEKVRVPRTIHSNPFEPELAAPAAARARTYGGLGIGLRQIVDRVSSGRSQTSSAGVMSKAEFLGKIRETVRNVSDRYRRISGPRRPIISRPVLVASSKDTRSMLPLDGRYSGQGTSAVPASNPFDDANGEVYTASLLTESPSTSTGERSIPRRRADFAPPKSPKGPREPTAAHIRRRSNDSGDSLISVSSEKTHASEAVVTQASRARSVKSNKSISGISLESTHEEGRPKLVPFTSSNRVPVPSLSSAQTADGSKSTKTKRVNSQSAKVFNAASKNSRLKGSVDELAMGMHYVRALGEHPGVPGARNSVNLETNPSTPTVSTNLRSMSGSSFSSLESSHHGHGRTSDKGDQVLRILVRANEKFKFKIPVAPSTAAGRIQVQLVSGQALPGFFNIDSRSAAKKGAVECYGVPTPADIGEVNVGVYVGEERECVGRAIVEVVGRT